MRKPSSLYLLATLVVMGWLSQAALAQNDFPEEEFDEPPTMNGPNGAPGAPGAPGAFGAPGNNPALPPLPPPPTSSGNEMIPPPPPSGPSNEPPNSFGGGSSFGSSGRLGRPTPGAKPSAKHVDMAHAQPEDITDENFPEMIESFDYPNADIKDVIKAMSELTGKNFILDNNVSGKITIIAPTRITVAEAYKAFLSALAVNSLTIVPSGKFLKITNSMQARRNSIETYSGTYYPTSDVMITRIVGLKYISAKDLRDRLNQLVTKDGDMNFYEQTNSLIITDYGSNIERLVKIVGELDKPGFEEQLEVMMLHHAKAANMADIIMQVINKESSGGKKSNMAPRIPRFNQPGTPKGGGAEQLSMVTPDDRTNSLIVLGNRAGLDKVRGLVKKLDFGLSPEESGGVFVYYVKHGEAEKIAATLNGVAGDVNKNKQGQNNNNNQGGFGQPPGFFPAQGGGGSEDNSGLFGGEVKVNAEKLTNSLIITASKTDYEIVKNILSKIDIPREQVFVDALITELNAQHGTQWGINYYQFQGTPDGKVAGRSGFGDGKQVANYFDPTQDQGAILSFGSGAPLTLTTPGGLTTTVTSMLGFLKFLTTSQEGNVLSNPRIVTTNNEESTIEVGQKVPIAQNTTSTAAGQTSSTQFENATIKLVLTPFISPNDDTVRMKIKQTVADVIPPSQSGNELSKTTQTLSTRLIDTNISVKSGDTAVLGGLIRNEDSINITKVPLLGDIPILGWLFKGQTVAHNKRSLVVFITPRVIRSIAASHKIMDERINERIDYIKDNMRGEDPEGKRIDGLLRRGEAGEPEPQPVPKMPKRTAQQNDTETTAPEKEHGEVEGGNTQQLIDETLRTF